ncbi:MAG: hypothetical protein ACRCXZ_05015 [Patescibacteria group bacterium]
MAKKEKVETKATQTISKEEKERKAAKEARDNEKAKRLNAKAEIAAQNERNRLANEVGTVLEGLPASATALRCAIRNVLKYMHLSPKQVDQFPKGLIQSLESLKKIEPDSGVEIVRKYETVKKMVSLRSKIRDLDFMEVVALHPQAIEMQEAERKNSLKATTPVKAKATSNGPKLRQKVTPPIKKVKA